MHIRIYLVAYVRYLCRTKSHLCRSQNKLLIIEIRRILALRKWFTHGRHPRTYNGDATWPLLLAVFKKDKKYASRRSRKYTRILLEILDHAWNASHAIYDYVTLSAPSLAFAHCDRFMTWSFVKMVWNSLYKKKE